MKSNLCRLIIVMGVSGSGKSTIGKKIAEHFGFPFIEGDDAHPPQNVEKMRAGIPLTDADRWPWLEALARQLKAKAQEDGAAIASCSALKHSYRKYLIEKAGEPILFVYLDGSKELIAGRIAARHHEYMPGSLLDSQFATLEPPEPPENTLTVSIDGSVDQTVDLAIKGLQGLERFKS